MSESQPDMLGGKAVPGSRLRRGRNRVAPVARDGWADKPGTGPAGETCGSCTFCEIYHFAKTYRKCAARPGHHWKGGRATDIRPLDPACSKWAPGIRGAKPIVEADLALQKNEILDDLQWKPAPQAAAKAPRSNLEERQYAFAL